MDDDIRACEVCATVAPVYVCSSPLGAISHAYCRTCLATGAQPYLTLIGGLWGCYDGEAGWAPWVEPIIDASLAVAKKSRDEFLADLKQADEEYVKHLQQIEPPPPT